MTDTAIVEIVKVTIPSLVSVVAAYYAYKAKVKGDSTHDMVNNRSDKMDELLKTTNDKVIELTRLLAESRASSQTN